MYNVANSPNDPKMDRIATIVVACMLLGVIVYALTGCNSTHKMQNQATESMVKDSAGHFQETYAVGFDSSVKKEEATGYEGMTDTTLREELIITARNKFNIENGQSEDKPMVIHFNEDSATIDAGNRDIEQVRVIHHKQFKKKDSSGTKTTTAAQVSRHDSSTTAKADSVHTVAKKEATVKTVDRSKTPWYLYAIGTGALLLAGFLLYHHYTAGKVVSTLKGLSEKI